MLPKAYYYCVRVCLCIFVFTITILLEILRARSGNRARAGFKDMLPYILVKHLQRERYSFSGKKLTLPSVFEKGLKFMLSGPSRHFDIKIDSYLINILYICIMPRTMLGTRNAVIKQESKVLPSRDLHSSAERGDNRQVNKLTDNVR